MRKERFERVMNSINNEFLEEAHAESKPVKKPARVWLRRTAAAAVCICLVAAGVNLWPAEQGQNGAVSLEDLQAQGFSFILPDAAEAAVYSMDETGEEAQAAFRLDGEDYVCTAMKAEGSEDAVSIGIYDSEEGPAADTEGNGGWISWFSEDGQVQYLLTAVSGNQDALVTTAREIMETAGLNMNVAPEGAENILYYTLEVEGSAGELLQTAATSFEADGIRYDYRTAPTGMFEVQDLSGRDSAYENSSQAELGWCTAELFWNEGEEGKILWLDAAPGLLYSLTMEQGASEEALLQAAGSLFVPVQDDAE